MTRQSAVLVAPTVDVKCKQGCPESVHKCGEALTRQVVEVCLQTTTDDVARHERIGVVVKNFSSPEDSCKPQDRVAGGRIRKWICDA